MEKYDTIKKPAYMGCSYSTRTVTVNESSKSHEGWIAAHKVIYFYFLCRRILEIRIAMLFQGVKMGFYGFAEGLVKVIRDAELFSGTLYNRADGGVVDAADPGEEMVLDLKIETAHVPAQDFAVPREVCRGAHLVDHPMLLDPVVFVRLRMLRLFDHVCQLKGDAHDDAGRQVEAGETDEPLYKGNIEQQKRQNNGVAVIEGLGYKKSYPFAFGMFLIFVGAERVLEKQFVIFYEYPEEACHGVGNECEVVLDPVNGFVLFVGREPDEPAEIKVFVVLVDVGVGVVDNIVGDLPDVAVGPEHVESIAQKLVDRLVGGVGAVEGVVGDGEADAGHAYAHEEGHNPHAVDRKRAAHDQRVGSEIETQQDNGFDYHLRVGVFGKVVLLKIGVDPFLDGFVKFFALFVVERDGVGETHSQLLAWCLMYDTALPSRYG